MRPALSNGETSGWSASAVDAGRVSVAGSAALAGAVSVSGSAHRLLRVLGRSGHDSSSLAACSKVLPHWSVDTMSGSACR